MHLSTSFIWSKMSSRRALHFVLKIGDRSSMMGFLKNTLGMKVLRHEEFDSGCKATCNGPYQNKWSKTMIGYGPESCNFVLEITYNYPVDKYRLGKIFFMYHGHEIWMYCIVLMEVLMK